MKFGIKFQPEIAQRETKSLKNKNLNKFDRIRLIDSSTSLFKLPLINIHLKR